VYIFSLRFGTLFQEQSGNPGGKSHQIGRTNELKSHSFGNRLFVNHTTGSKEERRGKRFFFKTITQKPGTYVMILKIVSQKEIDGKIGDFGSDCCYLAEKKIII
jgi:hypothetical protein